MSKVLDDLRAYETTIPNEQKPAVADAIKELVRLEGLEAEGQLKVHKEHLAQNKKGK